MMRPAGPDADKPVEGFLGVGVDIVEVERFRGLDDPTGARTLRRIFAPEELSYAVSKADPAPSLAARFAAKEAVLKALRGTPLGLVDLPRVRVETDADGSPRVRLPPGFDDLAVEVSLAHGRTHAIAFAVVHGTAPGSDVTQEDPQ